MAYQQGKTDAYEEIFTWLMHQSSTSGGATQDKNVSLQKFKTHMSDKIHSSHQQRDDTEFQMPQVVTK